MTNVRPVQQLQKLFEEFIQHSLQISLPESLHQPMVYIINIGGKRLRPLSLLSIADALKVNDEAALNAALAIELFHNFSLMHDDIMDNALLRRTRESTHVKFGVNSAILSGDAMLILSIQKIKTAENLAKTSGLTEVFLDTAFNVCKGQALDMEFENRNTVSLDEYLEMIENKTAVLLACCFKMAAMLSGNPELSNNLYKLGLEIGVGFQLEDDWLDYYGDEFSVGKIRAGDLIQRKKSALVILLSDELSEESRSAFNEWYLTEPNTDVRLKKLEKLFNEHQVKSKLRTLIDQYKTNCLKIIGQLEADHQMKSILKQLCDSIFNRTY